LESKTRALALPSGWRPTRKGYFLPIGSCCVTQWMPP
jgi:hypothetical protein